MDSDSEIDLSWVELASGNWEPANLRTEIADLQKKAAHNKQNRAEENVVNRMRATLVAASESTAGTTTCENKQLVVRREKDQAAAQGFWSDDEMYRIYHKRQKLKRPKQAGHAPKYPGDGRCIRNGCRNPKLTSLMTLGRQSILRSFPGRLSWRVEDRRPLAQPPAFDYEKFSNEFVPSDKMLKDMFSTDPVGRTAFRDAQTEFELLNLFSEYVERQHENCPCHFDWLKLPKLPCGHLGCQCRKERVVKGRRTYSFHPALYIELQIDIKDVGDEFDLIKQSLTDFQEWQRTWLDMDGELVFAQRELAMGKDVFGGVGGKRARAIYGDRLKQVDGLPWPPEHDMETWEWFHLGDNTDSTSKVVAKLEAGVQVFEPPFFGAVEARVKWGYLAWKIHCIQHGNRGDLKQQILAGIDPFAPFGKCCEVCPTWARNAAQSHYSSLFGIVSWPIKNDLEAWERFHLDASSCPTTSIKRRLITNGNKGTIFEPFYFGALQAREKWSFFSFFKLVIAPWMKTETHLPLRITCRPEVLLDLRAVHETCQNGKNFARKRDGNRY